MSFNKIIMMMSLLSVSAFAHIEIGTYNGKNQDGNACGFEVKSVSFLNNIRSPLNERVVIVAEGTTFEFAHRPIINFDNNSVIPDKYVFTASVGIPQAAWGAIMQMGDTEEVHGPVQLMIIYDDYKKPENDKKLVCRELVYQK